MFRRRSRTATVCKSKQMCVLLPSVLSHSPKLPLMFSLTFIHRGAVSLSTHDVSHFASYSHTHTHTYTHTHIHSDLQQRCTSVYLLAALWLLQDNSVLNLSLFPNILLSLYSISAFTHPTHVKKYKSNMNTQPLHTLSLL